MRYVFGSLTRISDLPDAQIETAKIDRDRWATGDYVVGEVYGAPSSLYRVELPNGRLMPVAEGDHVVGAFGTRAATLETTGDWREIGPDGKMASLTGAGLFGKIISRSSLMPAFLKLAYRGHVVVDGEKVGLKDYVQPVQDRTFQTPTIILIGSSMSSGKTTTARVFIRLLKGMGLSVTGVKLTGAGRFRDVLSMYDAGADHILDFVDEGLPSTICDEGVFRAAARRLLSRVEHLNTDVAVVEAGASPLEPYNGEAAYDELGANIRLTTLCASDPYAVLGVNAAFGHRADLVTGLATNTDAGIELIETLTGIQAVNVLDKSSHPLLEDLLRSKLEIENVTP